MEQGALGAVVLPVEEGEDDLFGGMVILFHIQSQVAEERQQVASQEQDRKDPSLVSPAQEGHRA